MEKSYLNEINDNFTNIKELYLTSNTNIFVFGHCNISEKLIDLIIDSGLSAAGILDNNKSKYNLSYRGVSVVPPDKILEKNNQDTIVLIAVNFYETMRLQLISIGFKGKIFKLVDYNSYSDFSLSEETIKRKTERCQIGIELLNNIKNRFPNHFLVFCPHSSLGDIYLCLAYLPPFLNRKGIDKCIICVPTHNGRLIAEMFGYKNICVLERNELEATIQASVFLHDKDIFISHTDKPYFIKLIGALHIKLITFSILYCCGVYGLPRDTKACEPVNWKIYSDLDKIPKGRSVILSPYAASVTLLPDHFWETLTSICKEKGYYVYTNISGEEKPLKETIGISPAVNEMKSVVEHAGIFIGLRSGLCDILRSAECHKVVLFPNYYFSSTKWKSIDVFKIDGFKNIEVKDDIDWLTLL